MSAVKNKKAKTSLEMLTEAEQGELDSKIVPAYMDFLANGKTPELTVEQVITLAEKAGLKKYKTGMKISDSPNGVYITDADGKIFSLILPGKRKADDVGISLMVSHADTPCLNLKSEPIHKGPEGVILATKPYGGLWVHNYLDSNVEIIGSIPRGEDKITVKLTGSIPDRSIQIWEKLVLEQKVKDAFNFEMIKVLTGYDTKKEFLNALKKQGANEGDFYKGSWYVVPLSNPTPCGNYIAGYRHDDISCVFATVKAALESKNRKFPVIVHGCSREELGSTDSQSISSYFMDKAFYALLMMEGMDEKDISVAVMDRIYSSSKALSCDVGIALTTIDQEGQDKQVAPRFNQGVVVVKSNGGITQAGGSCASDYMTEYVMDLLKKNNVAFQMSELPSLRDRNLGGANTIAKFLGQRNIPAIDAGPPIGSMHSKYPHMHIGDLAQIIKAYRVFVGRKK